MANLEAETAVQTLLKELRLGLTVEKLLAKIEETSQTRLSQGDLQLLRERAGAWKKFSDEVVPVGSYLRKKGITEGNIRFPQDNNPYDAWLRPTPSAQEIGIEVTIAGARQDVELHRHNRSQGLYPANLTLPDDAPKDNYKAALKRGRAFNSKEGITANVENQIRTAIEKKAINPGYQGGVLVIQAQLGPLSPPPWPAMAERLRDLAAATPFCEVVVVGRGDRQPLLMLKSS